MDEIIWHLPICLVGNVSIHTKRLSPIERLWQDVKYKLSFWLYETLVEHKNATGNILNGYSFEDIASLTGYRYILDAVNAL